MKLWNIPPQYLDDYHLIQDHDNCVTLFNLEDESIPDEFYAYLFLKARIDEDELEEPDYEDVAADIMLIVNVWETLLRSPYLRSGIDTKIEQLLLQSYEDIYHELVFSLQSKKESYE